MGSTAVVCNFRPLVDRYMREHQYKSALYWADKQYSLSCATVYDLNSIDDLLRLARCLMFTNQFYRAVQLLRNFLPSSLMRQPMSTPKQPSNHPPLQKRQRCEWFYLTSRCFMETGDLNAALDLLQSETNDETSATDLGHADAGVLSLKARLLLLKGHVHQALEDRLLAAECYRAALQLDVSCHEALDALLGHQMLTAEEEVQLINSLPFQQQLSADIVDSVKTLYTLQLKKYTSTNESKREVSLESASLSHPTALESSLPVQLLSNGDVMTYRAERLYYECDLAACWKVSCTVLQRDSDHPGCLLVHIVCLLDRGDTNRLFQLAHRLVSRYPEHTLAWFAVGAYYYCIGNVELARRYLNKSTSLQSLFAPSWLLYGHCFARDNEHDQAISAYLSAGQLMRGCHLPLLYAGLEYALTNNGRLAQQFFKQAQLLAPRDPCQLHEMGAAAFSASDYQLAENYFSRALQLVQSGWRSSVPQHWEPLYNNLAHTYRKLGKYQLSCDTHRQALLLRPHSASTYSALAFTCALMERPSEAVDLFHRALSLKRDDAFSAQMLDSVLQQMMLNTVCSGDAIDGDCGYCDYDVNEQKLSVCAENSSDNIPASEVNSSHHILHQSADCSNEMSLELD